MKSKTHLSKILFGEVGIEPTFFPSVEVPEMFAAEPSWREKYWDLCLSVIMRDLDEIPKTVSPRVRSWLTNRETCEGGGMEVPTPFQYINDSELVQDYQEMVSFLASKSLRPSSLIDMCSEGGCHINISTRRVEQEGVEEVQFKKNLMAFTNMYPSLVWMNLSPEDNVSSAITFQETRTLSKGDCVNDRSEYMELRFFIMPRSVEEFIFQLELANNIMWHVYEITKQEKFIRFKHTKTHLRHYKLETAIQEAQYALGLIGSDANHANVLGKFTDLAERFSLGSSHLV